MIIKSWYLNSEKYQIRHIFKLTALVLVFSACSVSTANLNLESDKQVAKKVTDSFYKELSARRYKETYPYFTGIFFSKVDTSTLNDLYRHYDDKYGVVYKVSLLKCETKRTNSDKERCTYLAVFKVIRSKGVTKERFLMQSEEDKEPKIFRYDIFERPVEADIKTRI